ncbi:adenosine deaminase [Sediminispirochaeta smaragdinae]|nr:adenosine deaminase [Sediminispirochaeta smaragdinae]
MEKKSVSTALPRKAFMNYNISMVTKEMIRQIPKVELHDHLDGGLRPETIVELADEYGIALPEKDPERLAQWLHRGSDRKSLPLYLESFGVTVAVLQKAEALERAAYEAILDVAKEHVVYIEIRFSPVLHLKEGLNVEAVVESVLKGLERGRRETGTEYGLILCAMRDQSVAISLEIAELAVAFSDRGVVGFDIAGDENGHPPKKHLEAFQYIRNRNFNITIHAGEAFGLESIWQAIQICGAHRIGHATRLIEDMSVHGTRIEKMGTLAHFIRDKRIPLEVCLSSNIQTGAAPNFDDHPFHIYFRNGFRVFLNTDNRLMSNTTLSKEMELAVKHYNLSLKDLERLTINAMKSSFAHYDERIKIIYDVLKPGYAEVEKTSGYNGH